MDFHQPRSPDHDENSGSGVGLLVLSKTTLNRAKLNDSVVNTYGLDDSSTAHSTHLLLIFLDQWVPTCVWFGFPEFIGGGDPLSFRSLRFVT